MTKHNSVGEKNEKNAFKTFPLSLAPGQRAKISWSVCRGACIMKLI
jgi:hypothetical protein